LNFSGYGWFLVGGLTGTQITAKTPVRLRKKPVRKFDKSETSVMAELGFLWAARDVSATFLVWRQILNARAPCGRTGS
jgi:hypothetical protein